LYPLINRPHLSESRWVRDRRKGLS